jgi:WD40 repeat protein
MAMSSKQSLGELVNELSAAEDELLKALNSFTSIANQLKESLESRFRQIDDDYDNKSQQATNILRHSSDQLQTATASLEKLAENIEVFRKEDTINMSKAQLHSRIASGGSDSNVRIWDVKTGKCIEVLKGHSGPVNCLTSDINGTIISGSNDKTAKLWKDNKCIQTLSGHKLHVQCATVKKDHVIVTGSGDKSIKLWDNGQCINTLASDRIINSVFELKDGNLAGACEKEIVVWDLQVFSAIAGLKHESAVLCAIPLSNGRIAGGYNDGFCRIWDVPSGTIVKTLEADDKKKLLCLLELSDGMIVGGYSNGDLRVWDVTTSECVRVFNGHTNCVYSVVELESGMIASASKDGTIKVWNIKKGVCIKTMKHEGRDTYACSLHRLQ